MSSLLGAMWADSVAFASQRQTKVPDPRLQHFFAVVQRDLIDRINQEYPREVTAIVLANIRDSGWAVHVAPYGQPQSTRTAFQFFPFVDDSTGKVWVQVGNEGFGWSTGPAGAKYIKQKIESMWKGQVYFVPNMLHLQNMLDDIKARSYQDVVATVPDVGDVVLNNADYRALFETPASVAFQVPVSGVSEPPFRVQKTRFRVGGVWVEAALFQTSQGWVLSGVRQEDRLF